MASFKVLSAGPHPDNPLNLVADIEIVDDSGEVIRLPKHVFRYDLTVANLEEQVGKIAANVLPARRTALAELQALVTLGGVFTPKEPQPVDPKQAAYQLAVLKLLEADRLVALKVIAPDAQEYTDALQAAKDAKAAMDGGAAAVVTP